MAGAVPTPAVIKGVQLAAAVAAAVLSGDPVPLAEVATTQ
jgi:hypothetical protein